MSALPEPHEIAARLIRRWASDIGKGNVRMHLAVFYQEAGINGLPDEALVTAVHELIGTAEITWPEAV